MSDAGAPAPMGFWRRLDARVYAIESALVIAATAIMSGLVFVAVVWRIFAAPESKLAALLARASGATAEEMSTPAAVIGLGIWIALCVFAVHTSKPRWQRRRCVAVGGGIALGCAGAAQLFVWAVPGGVVFSQRVALCLLMWVVLLGSSMAAHRRRHIFLQAAQKLVPESRLRAHAALGLIAAAAFTLFLAWVAAVYAKNNLVTWLSSDLRAGAFESIPIPYWTVTIAMPIGFFLTAARFFGQGIAIWRGLLPPVAEAEELTAAAVASEADT